MAKQKFTHFIPREKPKKRRGVHKKSQNKNEKRQKKKNNSDEWGGIVWETLRLSKCLIRN